MGLTNQTEAHYTNQKVLLIDAINNKPIAETQVMMVKGDIWALNNDKGQINIMLDKSRSFKISPTGLIDEDYRIAPIKLAKDFIIAKLIKNIKGRERRRYLRVSCNLETIITIDNEPLDGSILELAYGSLVVKIKKKLEVGHKVAVRVRELDGEALILGEVIVVKDAEHADEADMWFEGYTYVVSIDEESTGENAMDLLYGKICRMQKEIAANGA